MIDPYRTRTAALADWHIAIRPGTDAALALGIMHVILREGLEDRAYIAEMTHGFERLAARAREYTPERVAAWTGMTAAEVEQLAREYAATRPAAIRMNYGVQRQENGGAAVRAIAMLPAHHRRMEIPRRRRAALHLRRVSWNKQALERPDLAMGFSTPPRSPPGEHVHAGLRAYRTRSRTLKDGPAVHALFVYNSNPAAIAPNHNAVRARTGARRSVHRGPRPFLDRYDGLRGLRSARDHVS